MNTKNIEESVEKHLRDCVFCHEDIDIPFLDHIRVHNLVAELTQHHEAEVRKIRDELESWGGIGWSVDDYVTEVEQLVQALTPTKTDKQ